MTRGIKDARQRHRHVRDHIHELKSEQDPVRHSTERTGKWGVGFRSKPYRKRWKEGLGRARGWKDGAGNFLSVVSLATFRKEF